MENKFFEQFKHYLLNQEKERLNIFIPYYETLFQVKNDIKELLDDAEKYYMEIRYENDKYDGYTDGGFKFFFYTKPLSEPYGWQSNINHYYEMELLTDERMRGYCECSPEDEGFNPVHKCCGNGCDWYAPKINIKKVEGIAYHSFDGVERDMWQLESKWSDTQIDHEEQMRIAHLELIEREIRDLEEKKKKYLK